MRKIMKIMNTIFVVAILFTIFSNNIFAAVNVDNIKGNVNMSGENEITSIASYIYSTITTIGIVLSVVILAILGIKYMLGCASERADYKKTMMPYLIGAVLVFSASTIANVIYQLAK